MGGFAILMSVFVLVCFTDLVISAKSFRQGGEMGISLGFTCLGASIVTLSYTASFFARNYLLFSILSSIYFTGIAFMLTSLVTFTGYWGEKRYSALLRWAIAAGMLVDFAFFAINPFCEILISYESVTDQMGYYVYQLHPLYYVHLGFTYVMVVIVLYDLIRRGLGAPLIYGRQYFYCVLAVAAVVAMNAVYLFAPDLLGIAEVDYSLLGYSIAAFCFYWNCFNYSSHGLIGHFHSWIFENVDQAIVLFDFNDKLIMTNQKAEQMLPDGVTADGMSLMDFLTKCGIKPGHERNGTHYTFQCFLNSHPVRCDYSVQLDRKQRRLGRLFVFSSVTTQYDMLTGFHNWADFQEHAEDLVPANGTKQIVLTCDINSLADINRKFGRDTGDRAIQRLAEEMRTEFPAGTIFVRSYEASLAAICSDLDIASAEATVARIQEKLQQNDVLRQPIQLQSSVSVRGEESAADTIRRNLQSMRTKKLMDRSSVHSEMLRSLLQALSQCDPDTGAHVQRTQKSGEALGRRIGLTDQQQSHLALLAILHDIGKIGIPLEILNKPGKLTDSEWKMMKTHVDKGFQIARSSQELSSIADMILYHHERWDGRGYPEGLSGEQIPLLSRIISVVDSYDAMTNDRAYRKALSESAARSELQRCAGSQFDPNIVKVFLQMLEEQDQKQGVTVSTMSQQESDARSYGIQPLLPPQEKGHRNVHIMAYSMYVVDGNSRIVEVDDRFETMTGYTKEDVQQTELTQMSMIFEEDRNEYFAQVGIEIAKNQDVYLEHRLRRKDGTQLFVYCYGHVYYDSAVGENRTRIVIIDSDDPFGEA